MQEDCDHRPPPINRRDPFGGEGCARIGDGEIGGKASGLWRSRRVLAESFPVGRYPEVRIAVPPLVVVTTAVFVGFMERNCLTNTDWETLADDRIVHIFRGAELPVEFLGDLRSLIEHQHTPLAVRSSSLLEDAIYEPFAGVYETKMIPNNQYDADQRFRKLVEAIKFVWASTFFADARRYIRNTRHEPTDERMAVIVQELVGRRHHLRFYPTLSGVARSYNYYPTGHARPEQGVVQLALGLGKSVVDGGVTWTYSPAYPQSGPPFSSARDRLRGTQTTFWAVNMGEPDKANPLVETEYLVQEDLSRAERDGSLVHLASTYDPANDRVRIGCGTPGPRILDFAPLLRLEKVPINRIVKDLLAAFEDALGEPVEIEFAATLPRREDPVTEFGFLQVRPLVVAAEQVEVTSEDLTAPGVLLASEQVLGNGESTTLEDVVYLRPEAFDAKDSRAIASEVAALNDSIAAAGRWCLLVGFGRWGSSDPWLGVPVTWGQIGRARAVVEATTPTMSVEPSQGSHFFHNMTSFGVFYFAVPHMGKYSIDWTWLDAQPAVAETMHARWVRLNTPLWIRVDGRGGRGFVARRT